MSRAIKESSFFFCSATAAKKTSITTPNSCASPLFIRTFTTCQLSAVPMRIGQDYVATCNNTFTEIVEGRLDMHAYICGLDKMVKANRELLKSLGWDRKSIRYEKYD